MADDPRHPPRRIIVGIDGSEGARRALVWALAEARAHDAILEVVAAWALPADWAQGYNPERHVDLETKARLAAEETRAFVEETVGSTELPDGLEITTVEGQPAAVLLERAEDADLVVVGSRGRGGFSRLVLGSVSSAVVHHCSTPVVVIPAGA